MESINDRERESACSDISTPSMIVARPGSGKTSTMVGRVLMLMHEGIDPSHILAMTFTTAAAASEMRAYWKSTGKDASQKMFSLIIEMGLRECSNETSQCAYVVDKILEITSEGSSTKCNGGNIAVLYRRPVSGKIFQATFDDRRIPFNIHGVAFYRKKDDPSLQSLPGDNKQLHTENPQTGDAPATKELVEANIMPNDDPHSHLCKDEIELMAACNSNGFFRRINVEG